MFKLYEKIFGKSKSCQAEKEPKRKPYKFKAMEKVYVYLEEDDWCYRPTQAKRIAGDIFELLPTDDYDPEDEVWRFVPGSYVRCAYVTKENATDYGMQESSFERKESIIIAHTLFEFQSVDEVFVSFADRTGFPPIPAKHIKDNIFELQDSEYTPYEDDEWVFKPGDIVRCAISGKNNSEDYGMASDRFDEQRTVIVAYELAEL